MSEFLRPEARAALWRWREVGFAALVLATGLRWGLASFGALQIVGWALAVVGAGLGVVALRRLRFSQGGGGPGVVQINERRLAYFGPLSGGVMDMDDLIRLELDGTARPAHWRLTGQGEHLAIPVNAEGADALFDVFASLPGLRTDRMLETLGKKPETVVLIWQARAPDTLRLH
ncbi:hypothetical protein [Flavimaricola marinus]|uniref:Uncharacterized protein n=1 Tax=Flavimaricola marinus TaxID=1819565 RepID=A0A238LB23_9RHOB|nr:hypothetical protein [Flavimaricola marinus]SMY06828.1 hypothetical protein LOM8899_00958 [Flavimaricola marinus]